MGWEDFCTRYKHNPAFISWKNTILNESENNRKKKKTVILKNNSNKREDNE